MEILLNYQIIEKLANNQELDYIYKENFKIKHKQTKKKTQ